MFRLILPVAKGPWLFLEVQCTVIGTCIYRRRSRTTLLFSYFGCQSCGLLCLGCCTQSLICIYILYDIFHIAYFTIHFPCAFYLKLILNFMRKYQSSLLTGILGMRGLRKDANQCVSQVYFSTMNLLFGIFCVVAPSVFGAGYSSSPLKAVCTIQTLKGYQIALQQTRQDSVPQVNLGKTLNLRLFDACF